MIGEPSPTDTSWGGLLTSALTVGAQIYQSQLAKKSARRAAKAQASDFPQLGMGLTASGPQRGQMNAYATPVGSIQIGPGGIYLGDSDQSQVGGGGAMASSAMVPRGPVYAISTNPNGGQRLVAVRSIGTPLLWSGDLAAVRRVARVARKLGRFIHHRRPR